ncbi:hypothetical protein ACRYKS_20180 [Escherichia coli]|uniref:Uncharacterized protein n=1 Tax=Escherichia phage fEgEco12 TaxID=3158837 RepID=A0AAU7PHJ2_9CAUD|nr:hypothetical protein [Escherichia coli]QAY00381.1 hypothetical protein Ecwhy1_100 [Escherichia phage Ecwhy_1]QXN76399.1 hypothetical protein [Escherichia phage BF17]WGM49653.1 hypothetical protein EcMJ_411 [Escherichia phage vB_Ec-M-J]ELW0836330.1 hypothetical protein [Escherichia coli]VVY17390.1 Uncharacterised protein [Escherichia coli]
MITDDGKYSFSDVTLVSKNGRFMFEDRTNTKYVYEVSHDMFKYLLIVSAQAEAMGVKNKANSFNFLFNQLEMTEDLFTALLYDYADWIS